MAPHRRLSVLLFLFDADCCRRHRSLGLAGTFSEFLTVTTSYSRRKIRGAVAVAVGVEGPLNFVLSSTAVEIYLVIMANVQLKL